MSVPPRRGFALMAAMWLVVLVGVAGYALSSRARVRRLGVANALERAEAAAAADAAIETGKAALAWLIAHPSTTNLALDPWAALDDIRRDTIRLGDERAVVHVYDANARLNLNAASEADLQRLLAALGVDAAMAEQLAAGIMDWRDADDLRRSRGMERDDYLRIGARKLPSNTDFARVDELRDVHGMTDRIYSMLAENVTVFGNGRINVNAAPRAVLATLPGVGDETIAAIVSARTARRPIRSVEELGNQLTGGARQAMVDAGGELSRRVTFAATDVVVEGWGSVKGGFARVGDELVLERSGDAMLVVSHRRVE